MTDTTAALVTGGAKTRDTRRARGELGEAHTTRSLRGLELILAELGVPDLVIGHIHGRLTLDAVRGAAERAQARHPGLRALVNRQAERPRFVYHEPTPDLVEVLEVRSDDGLPGSAQRARWERVAERESMHSFGLSTRFAFRVVWVPHEGGGHLIVNASHALVDGISLLRLLSEISGDAAALMAGRALPEVISLAPTRAVLDSIAPRRFDSILGRVGKAVTLSQQKNYAKRSVLPIRGRLEKGGKVETNCSFHVGSEHALLAVREKCRALGPTVGGLYTAAVELATLRFVVEEGGRLPLSLGKIHLPITMDFSLRTSIEGASKTQEEVGLFTGVANVDVRIGRRATIWELARALTAQSQRQIRRRMPLLFHHALDTITSLGGELTARDITYEESGGVADGINISNVGPYPYPTALGQLELRDVFGLNGALLGGPTMIFWLRTINEHFCYNATAASPALDRESGERLFGYVVDIMETVGSSRFDRLSIEAYATGGGR
jgi:hypothetical protein